MRRFLLWSLTIIVIAGASIGAGILLSQRGLLPSSVTNLTGTGTSGTTTGNATQRNFTAAAGQTTAPTQTVAIRPADSVLGRVSAAGNVALSSQHYVVLGASGTVNQVVVKVGAVVKAGDLLVALDTTDAERALRRAELAVATSKNSLAQLQEPSDPSEIAQAEAELLAAQINLEDVQTGPSAEEVAAARASVASFQAEYSEATAPISDAERTQLEADLKKAQIAVQAAQRNYDKVAWQNAAGMTSEAADLQDATVEYERAKAAYEVATEPAKQSQLQSVVSNLQDARQKLADLLAQPTAADIATAASQVASAQTNLDNLKRGPTKLEVEAAQIQLEEALVDLEEAHANLALTKVYAPIDGTVMQVNAQVGQQLPSGEAVVLLADTTKLELPVQVAEVDIDQVSIGQAAEVAISALSSRQFTGVVDRISPASDGESGVVNYQVVIRLTDDLSGVRPDMTAVATLVNATAGGGWLVPTDAIRNGPNGSIVLVVRNGATTRIPVTTGAVQGEWTVVQSPELQADDQVVGSLTSYVNQDNPFTPRGPFVGGARQQGGGQRQPNGGQRP